MLSGKGGWGCFVRNVRPEPGLAALHGQTDAVAEIGQGSLLYVFDRNDSAPRWYRCVTREGIEGWIAEADVQLSWIDPLKVNREAFLSQ